MILLVSNFAPVFSKPVWSHARILLLKAILAASQRTVSSALRSMGLADEKHFINDHRVLSRAIGSSWSLSRILLGWLLLLRVSADALEVHYFEQAKFNQLLDSAEEVSRILSGLIASVSSKRQIGRNPC